MSSLQIIRRRIRSIQNTHQITKAMELVAASKMRRAQQQTLQSRPYAHEGLTLISDLSNKINRSIHPLLAHRKIEKILLIVITSDRGLAGAYNALLLREVIKFLQLNKHQKIDFITIGKKGQDALNRIMNDQNSQIIATYTNFPVHPTISDVIPIGKTAIDFFASARYDSVQIGYTHFHSTVKQEPIIEGLLPVTNDRKLPSEDNDQVEYEYQFEPNPDQVFDLILPRIIETQIYQRILEAIASEHSARMIAMKNASDNANEIIGDLQLTYNSARQAKITQELLEISSPIHL